MELHGIAELALKFYVRTERPNLTGGDKPNERGAIFFNRPGKESEGSIFFPRINRVRLTTSRISIDGTAMLAIAMALTLSYDPIENEAWTKLIWAAIPVPARAIHPAIIALTHHNNPPARARLILPGLPPPQSEKHPGYHD